MPFYGWKCTKRICKKYSAQPPYSKTAKLLIKNAYNVKSYLMDYVGEVKFIVKFAALMAASSGECIRFHF